MANRRFEQFCYTLIKKKTEIEGVASLSAAGAVLSQEIQGATLTKTATGTYTLTLQDKYSACVGIYCDLAETSQTVYAAPGTADVTGTKQVIIKVKANSTGADTDLTATAKLYVKVVLRNSSII